MSPTPQQLADWQLRASKRGAIVPADFSVFPTYAILRCGSCGNEFKRNLVPNVNDPCFACPNRDCGKKNFLPITFNKL